MACVDRVEKDFISNPNFRPDYIRTKSSAAAGLCAWVINICKYFRIYQARSGRGYRLVGHKHGAEAAAMV